MYVGNEDGENTTGRSVFCIAINDFCHNYCFSIFTADWLTVVITPPATARYPAIFTSNIGKVTGAARIPALIAASNIPLFRSFLKNKGVGRCILFLIEVVAYII